MLNSLFLSLLERLESAHDGVVYLAPEQLKKYDASAVSILQKTGLIEKAQPLTHIACDGCEQSCIMLVQFREQKHGKAAAFIVCDKRDDIGRVGVDLSRLEMQIFTLAGLAAWFAKLLATGLSPQEIEVGRLFSLGSGKIRNKRHDVFLCRNPQNHPAIMSANAPLIIALCSREEYLNHPLAVAQSLVYFENAQPCIEHNYLQSTIQRHNASDEIALEIELVNSEIILVNHVTDKRTTLAKTDFGSKNDSAFEYVYANAGKKLTEQQIIEGAEINGLNIQKFIEQIGFSGNLRKLFWQAAKTTVRFNRTATYKQLSALGIDPASLPNPV